MVNKNKKLAQRAKRSVLSATPIPRNRMRINRMDKAGAVVRSRFYQASLATTAVAQMAGAYGVAPPLNGSVDPGAVVLSNYQEYRMLSGTLHYVPQVGSTTAGTVWIGYYDNPEIIYKAYQSFYTTANLLALAQTAPHSVSAPVWQAVDLSIPMRSRRKVYSVDTTLPGSSSTADLTVHGIIVIATTGAPFSTTVGTITQEYAAEGFGLQSLAITGV